jgi:hypothetical protein
MPGVVEVSQRVAVGLAIDDLIPLAEDGEKDDLEGKECYLPLR